MLFAVVACVCGKLWLYNSLCWSQSFTCCGLLWHDFTERVPQCEVGALCPPSLWRECCGRSCGKHYWCTATRTLRPATRNQMRPRNRLRLATPPARTAARSGPYDISQAVRSARIMPIAVNITQFIACYVKAPGIPRSRTGTIQYQKGSLSHGRMPKI